jgi:proteic killer suppression protein
MHNSRIFLTAYRLSIYDKCVIRSFEDDETEHVFQGRKSRKFQSIQKTAMRKLFQLHAARTLQDLRAPGNSLEALRDDRGGQHSIRINDQYRLCFVWRDGDAYGVGIVDYH